MIRRWLQHTRMVTAEQARKITGISTPFGGISWADSGPSDTETIRAFVLFLEDRRALYNPMDIEVVDQVAISVHQIRNQCTHILQALPPNAFAVVPIRNIRLAARRFHDNQHEEFHFLSRNRNSLEGSPDFFVALGTFRATVGMNVAQLAAHYNINVEGDLAAILPDFEDDVE